MAMRCCSPPESVGGLALARSVRPDPGEHLAHRRFDIALGHAGDAQRQRDIVIGREMRDQPEVLEHHADPAAEAGQALARQRTGILAEQPDHAAASGAGRGRAA